MFVISEFILGL